MRYYKVTRDYSSVYMGGKYSLKYRLKEKTVPSLGYIYAFSSVGAARNFLLGVITDFEVCQILSGTGSRVCRVVPIAASVLTICEASRVEEFWRVVTSKSGGIVSTIVPPPGTIWLRDFTPLEVIK